MKALKIIGISIISILAVLYISFLFILPNVININNYKSDIETAVKDLSGLEFNAQNMKLKTTWNLHAGVVLEDVSIKYPNKNDFLSAQKGEAGIKLLPLILLKVELAPIRFETPKLDIAIEKDGTYDIINFINDLLKKQNQPIAETDTAQPMPISISNNMPNIVLNNYNISLKDKKTQDILKITGDEFKISEFKLNDKIKITTAGALTINDKKHLAYNAKIESFLPEIEQNQEQNTTTALLPNINFNPIPVIKKYNFGANVDTDLKISQKDKDILLKGHFNATDINYKLQGQNLDKNFIKLAFKGNQIDINSNLYVDKTEKFVIEGLFKNGKKQNINLHIVSNKIDLVDIQKVLIALTDIANIKTELPNLNITGTLDSNFTLKSDMKKLESDGYLKIANASIRHTQLPLTISSIRSNLDFNGNKISTKDTSALVNGSLFNAMGQIDGNANADIKVTADKLPLNLLYEAFAPVDLKKTLKITNGTLSLNTTVKGQLANIEPKVNLNLAGLKIRETAMKIGVGLNTINVDLTANAKGEYKGTARANALNLTLDEPRTTLTMPIGELTFDTKDITINPSTIQLDNSNLTINGTIKDYATKLNASIIAKGKFHAVDALKYIPKENRSMVSAKGDIPLVAQITSDGKITKINAQAFANAANNLTVLDIKGLRGKNSIANAELETDGSTLKISDIGLYGLNRTITPNINFKDNINSAQKVANIDGKVGNLSGKVQTLQNIKVSTPNTLNASIPGFKNSTMSANANININGTVTAPIIKGSVSIPQISIPDYKFTGKNIAIDFNKDVIIAKSPQIDLNGSSLAFDTSISTNFGKYTTINSLNVNSSYLDIDKILAIMEAMPQDSVAPSASIPVIINKGHGSLARVKSGELVATNATGDFTLKNNLFKLTNMKATAYNGVVAGTVNYNIPYETVQAKVQGRGLDSNPAVTAAAGLKDQIQGKLDFDANISMIGSTYQQQMKTLKGNVDFSIGEGQMGSLGRLEHFIYASNLLSQKFAQSTLNSVIQTLAPKNTGKFQYLKGHLTFANGWANLSPVHSGGPQMSLYISGKFNLLNNYANLEILGRVAKEVVSVMGPVGDFSVSKLLGNLGKFGTNSSSILNSYNAVKDAATIAKVPQLVPQSTDTKQFQVVIDGNIEKPSSVRTFKWVASEAEIKAAKAQIATHVQNIIPQKVNQYLKLPTTCTNSLTGSITPSSTVQTTTNQAAQNASNALKESAKNAASQALQNALPSFWNKIE